MTIPQAPQRRSVLFGDLVIEYDDRVLAPREWTTLQSAWAAELLAQTSGGKILELCTGAGHIGLWAAQLSGRELVAVDLDEVACEFARANAAAAGMRATVEVRQGAIDEVLDPGECFPVIIADPPWVTSAHIETFPHDPQLAIDGGPDGLDVARRCVDVAAHHLDAGGSLLLQLGDETQCDRIVADVPAGALIDGGRRSGDRGVILRLVATG